MQQPIIFIGMHRSGTSMLERLLEKLGLFVGVKKESNNEALFFLEINNWLLQQCGARWDNPSPINQLWEREDLLKITETYVDYLLNSIRSAKFLGLRRYLFTGGISKINFPWGWKDPRNTFTLPFWLRIFPNAKIIHIKRHGVDVSHSLRVRGKKYFKNSTHVFMKYKKLFFFHLKPNGFFESLSCNTLNGAFEIWKIYVDRAEEIINTIPNSNLLEIYYEELLKNPNEQLKKCANFCGISVADTKIRKTIVNIDCSRSFAFKRNDKLKEFAKKNAQSLIKRGYNPYNDA